MSYQGGWDPRHYDIMHTRASVERNRQRAGRRGVSSLPTIVIVFLLPVLIPYWAVRGLLRLIKR